MYNNPKGERGLLAPTRVFLVSFSAGFAGGAAALADCPHSGSLFLTKVGSSFGVISEGALDVLV